MDTTNLGEVSGMQRRAACGLAKPPAIKSTVTGDPTVTRYTAITQYAITAQTYSTGIMTRFIRACGLADVRVSEIRDATRVLCAALAGRRFGTYITDCAWQGMFGLIVYERMGLVQWTLGHTIDEVPMLHIERGLAFLSWSWKAWRVGAVHHTVVSMATVLGPLEIRRLTPPHRNL